MSDEAKTTSQGKEGKSTTMKRHEMTTASGYPLDEAASALQKEVRRGNAVAAMFWAKELEARYYKYMWRRLEIICAEDIGLGNPQAIVVVHTLAETYLKHKKESTKGKPDGNLVAMAILYMANSDKNRSVDNFKNLTHVIPQSKVEIEVPGYALDGHNQRGRELLGAAKGNPFVWWYTYASKVNNEQRDPYLAKNIARILLFEGKPGWVDDAKSMLKERFPDEEEREYYSQEIKHWLEILKPLHPQHAESYSDEEREEALHTLLTA